jgi:hypothetical protein
LVWKKCFLSAVHVMQTLLAGIAPLAWKALQLLHGAHLFRKRNSYYAEKCR